MRMVPSQILRSSSDAERLVFELLRKVDLGAGATALHSLNLPEHQYKRWCEADFVLVCERGILLLEVKGGRIACRNGIWEFLNRYGQLTRKSESPAAQASTAFYSLKKNYLDPRFGRRLHRVPMGWAVVFTDIDRLVSEGRSMLPEQPDEITAYRAHCNNPSNFRRFLDTALLHWKMAGKGAQNSVSASLSAEIVDNLRPSFEQVPPLSSSVDQLGKDLAALTDEQYSRLDDIQENARIIIRGGAGTGKTFLAMAAARYDQAQGHEVVITTRSEFLVQHLKAANPPPGVDVVRFDELADALKKRGRRWSTLIIDEGQDLCQAEALEVLDRVVEAGLEKGRWRWFGDPNRQVSYMYLLDEDVLHYLGELATKCRLRKNVRNAPRIVRSIELYTGADVGAPAPTGQGPDVQFIEIPLDEEPVRRVAALLRGWTSPANGIPWSDIAVLVPTLADVDHFATTLARAGIRAEPLGRHIGGTRRNAVLLAAVEQFKGLERPLVCVAGFGSNEGAALQSHIYRSFSRANHTLAVICRTQEMTAIASCAVGVAGRENRQGVANVR